MILFPTGDRRNSSSWKNVAPVGTDRGEFSCGAFTALVQCCPLCSGLGQIEHRKITDAELIGLAAEQLRRDGRILSLL